MSQHTVTQLREMKLQGMAQAVAPQQEQPGTYQGLSFDERLQLLVDSEQQAREQRKQTRLLKAAMLKIAANAQDINYEHPRGLNKSMIAGLLSCDWVMKHQNLLVTGPCGSGKTYIACALAHTAILKGYSVKYYRLSRLMLVSLRCIPKIVCQIAWNTNRNTKNSGCWQFS
ncbi:ATP-binding protein [Idiomarina aminovorans]|uniref:ATP-binding protein n=1 Tax=Idiomarina aminovorans TaxID=2914829 RepID=UPI002003C885|nr:ATP-binding protein [Idiomarina sp. ATCH4]MCK7460010.1 ATP-binding protein [Idiomarina sp. ATCH4]